MCFLYNEWENKDSELNDSTHFPHTICYSFCHEYRCSFQTAANALCVILYFLSCLNISLCWKDELNGNAVWTTVSLAQTAQKFVSIRHNIPLSKRFGDGSRAQVWSNPSWGKRIHLPTEINLCNKIINSYTSAMEPGSSVSIVSDYGLDGRGSVPDRGFFL
jgi:hypothetical protein